MNLNGLKIEYGGHVEPIEKQLNRQGFTLKNSVYDASEAIQKMVDGMFLCRMNDIISEDEYQEELHKIHVFICQRVITYEDDT